MNPRHCILKILEEFDRGHYNLDIIIDKVLSLQKIDHRDKRLVFEIVYGVMRHKLTLDYVLTQFLDEKRLVQNNQLMWIMRIGMYQIVYLDRIPDHAAVNESVQLAKNDKHSQKVAGVVNAVLRKIATTKKRLPKPAESGQLIDRLSVTYSHPQWLVQRWLTNFGLSKTKKLLAFNNKRPDIFLRRKIRGLSRQHFESEARSICDTASGGRGFKNLYYRLKKPAVLENIGLLNDGWCTIQAESSGWVVALLDIKNGDKLLDACSAPGGKTSLMSELTGKNGAVCACELQFPRLKNVRDTIMRMDLINVHAIACNGMRLPFKGRFDKALIDAPCSGTGVMHRHPEARWLRKERDIMRCAAIQSDLLDGIAPYIIPQGILVYATCSLEPEENHYQVENFLHRHPEFILEKPFGMVTDKYIDDEGYLSITPYGFSIDGMFAARMRKISE